VQTKKSEIIKKTFPIAVFSSKISKNQQETQKMPENRAFSCGNIQLTGRFLVTGSLLTIGRLAFKIGGVVEGFFSAGY
jgi:hypothetical protein